MRRSKHANGVFPCTPRLRPSHPRKHLEIAPGRRFSRLREGFRPRRFPLALRNRRQGQPPSSSPLPKRSGMASPRRKAPGSDLGVARTPWLFRSRGPMASGARPWPPSGGTRQSPPPASPPCNHRCAAGKPSSAGRTFSGACRVLPADSGRSRHVRRAHASLLRHRVRTVLLSGRDTDGRRGRCKCLFPPLERRSPPSGPQAAVRARKGEGEDVQTVAASRRPGRSGLRKARPFPARLRRRHEPSGQGHAREFRDEQPAFFATLRPDYSPQTVTLSSWISRESESTGTRW